MVTAIAMVKDESDIVESTVTRMLAKVDRVVVADNRSIDGTLEILARLAKRYPELDVRHDPEIGYYQSQKMSDLAASVGEGWIVPFDADEVWNVRDGRTLKGALEELPDDVSIVEADLYDHVATAEDPDEADPVKRITWRRGYAGELPKVAFRWEPGAVIHQGNHGVTLPSKTVPLRLHGLLAIRHFPYRSVEQFVSKARNGAAAYAATDLDPDMGGHWRGYGEVLAEHGEQGIADVFHKWFWRERPAAPLVIEAEKQAPLVQDPCP